MKGVYDMGLDFSKLNQISGTAIVQNVQKPVKEDTPESEQVQTSVSLDAVSDRNRRSLEMYSTYQRNIIEAETLESEITKGLQQGKPLAILFLQAMKIISNMTGNPFTYQNTAEILQAVYGFGLHKPDAEAVAAENVQNRLDKLKHSLETVTDRTDRAHIQNAIREHEKQLAMLNQSKGVLN